MPSLMNQAERVGRRAKALEAKGTPLSVRMRFGRPYSRNSLMKCFWVSSREMAGWASTPSRYLEARSETVRGKQ